MRPDDNPRAESPPVARSMLAHTGYSRKRPQPETWLRRGPNGAPFDGLA